MYITEGFNYFASFIGHSFESWNCHKLYKFLKFMVKFWPISTPEHRTTKWKFWMIWWAIYYIWVVEIPRFRQFFPILPISGIVVMKPIPPSLPHWKRREFRHHGRAVGRTIRCYSRGEGYGPLFYSTATDSGNGISPSPGSWRHSLYRKKCLQQFKLWGVLYLRPLTPGCPARWVSPLWVRVG